MALRHIPGDGQTEPRTALVPASGVVQADEPLEDPLPLVLGHTRPVVTDREHDPAAFPRTEAVTEVAACRCVLSRRLPSTRTN